MPFFEDRGPCRLHHQTTRGATPQKTEILRLADVKTSNPTQSTDYYL